MFNRAKDFRYQSFRKLKSDCVRADNLFNDGMFGADHLCLDINGTMQNRVLQWLRPKEIYPDPRLGIGAPKKGKFSSPAITAALTAVSTRLQVKEHIIAKDQEWNPEKPGLYRGIFHFQYHYFGQWTDVVIDDRLPTEKHKLVYMASLNENEFWPALVEKAYAKLHGGYNVINMIPVTDILSDLTGGVSEILDLSSYSSDDTSAAEEWLNLFEMIAEARENNTLFIATKSVKSKGEDGNEEPVASDNCILENGLYPVADIKKVNIGSMFNKDLVYLMKLISPTDDIYTGPYSPSSSEWANLGDSNKKDLRLCSSREFWMPVAEFSSEFTHMVINHVINTSLLALSKTWRREQFRSWWGDGRAGGFSSDKNIFIRCNHQYFMDISDHEVIVIIELTQKPQYTGAISSNNPFDDGKMPAFKKIGFAILEIEANREYRLHRTHYEITQKSDFNTARSISLRLNLPAGRYCVIPCTYDMNERGEFVLRVFSTKSVNIRHVMDEQPSIHWLLKCFQKPSLAAVSLTVGRLEMIEGILDNPEALDTLSEHELYVSVECEQAKVTTSTKYGNVWNEEFTVYLTSPVTAHLTVKVLKKQMIGSGMIGSSTLALSVIFGSVKALDDTRNKKFDMRLRDRNDLNLEIQLKMEASFFTDLMEV